MSSRHWPRSCAPRGRSSVSARLGACSALVPGARLKAASPSPLTPAPLWRRAAALVYDLLVILALGVCFTLAILAVRLGRAVPAGSVWFELCLLGIAFLFFAGFWARGGQTLGMRAWRIRVVAEDGGALGPARAALRFAAGLAALLPAGLGFWWGAFDSQRRGWHDRWSRTRVVRT